MLPRVKNATATREAMLASARRRFLEESYENVGLRDIAGDVGVDVALVGRYFGSKEELFKEVLRKGGSDWLSLAAQAEDLPAFLATLAEKKDSEADDHIERLLIILRSASSPQASSLVRSAFSSDVLDPLAGLLSGPQAEMRAAMALSVLMGTTIVRTIMKLEEPYQCEHGGFQSKLAAILRAALAAESD
jgi:AcrR family transcriptional regulator